MDTNTWIIPTVSPNTFVNNNIKITAAITDQVGNGSDEAIQWITVFQ